MRKKTFSIIMSLLMVITMIPLFAVDSHATEPIDYFYIKNESNNQLSVGFSSVSGFYFEDFNLQYSTDPTTGWTDLTIKPGQYNFVTQLLNNGDKVYFRCNDSSIYNNRKLPNLGEEAYIFFDISGGSHSAGGDIRTLIADPESSLESITNIGDRSFWGLFYNDNDLISYDGDLNFSFADMKAFAYMFANCGSLKRAPNMNIDTLSNNTCDHMYYSCTSLEDAPILSATDIEHHCYQFMFKNCSSLKTPPQLIALKVPAHGYYNMFSNCTSLEYIPELPASETESCAYGDMFSECTQFKILSQKPTECYRVFKMPSDGIMFSIGLNFNLSMFAGTLGEDTPLANAQYYVVYPNSEHSYSYSWNNENNHLKICSACGNIKEENHSFGEPLISNGLKITECTYCGFKHIEAAPSTGGGSSIGGGESGSKSTSDSATKEIGKLKDEVKELKSLIKFTKTSPAKSAIKIEAKKKKINIKWKKIPGATRYQIRIKRKGEKPKTIEFRANINNRTIRHLKSKKKYYIEIRGIKKASKSTVYSKWSKRKYVRVK